MRAYESAHGELKEGETPAPSFIEGKLEEVEEGELLPDSLRDVISKTNVAGETYQNIQLHNDGSLRLQKGKKQVSLPRTPEEFRTRIRLLGRMFELLRLKYLSGDRFKGYSEAIWERYTNWILGDDVYGLSIKIPGSNISHSASWATLLDLDFQVRKDMANRVNEGKTLTDAPQRSYEQRKGLQSFF